MLTGWELDRRVLDAVGADEDDVATRIGWKRGAMRSEVKGQGSGSQGTLMIVQVDDIMDVQAQSVSPHLATRDPLCRADT